MDKIQETLAKAGLAPPQVDFASTALMHGSHQIVLHGSVPLQALIVKKDEGDKKGGIILLACPALDHPDAKDMFMETVRYMAHQEDAHMVGLVMEAWTAPQVKDGDEMERLLQKYGSISAMPDKREAICVMVDSDEGKFQLQAPIERDENGELSGLAEIKVHTDKDGELTGRMMESRYSDQDKADPGFEERLAFMAAFTSDSMKEIEPEQGSSTSPSMH